jgi:hypothetical protein
MRFKVFMRISYFMQVAGSRLQGVRSNENGHFLGTRVIFNDLMKM